MPNLISLEVSDQLVLDIKTKLSELKTLLQPILNANVGEVAKRQYMGQSSKGYVDDCRIVADQFPEILPGTFSLKEMDIDLKYISQISAISADLLSITQQVLKTEQTTGQDLMDASNTIYKLLKEEAKRDKAKYGATEAKLKQRYQQRKDTEQPAKIVA